MQDRLDTLEKRLYQLIISRLDGDMITLPEYCEKIYGLVRKGIGGFILFGGERAAVRDFIKTLQSMAEIPLFIASDIERGVNQQLRGGTFFPCQMAVRAAIDNSRPEAVLILREAIRAIAGEAIDSCINMPLIPVLDVNRNPDNPIICTRAFSDDPDDVSWFGSEYIRVLQGQGLISCAKHFPGHGDTSVDSHISLPVIHKTYDELVKVDVLPFRKAIEAGVGSIMIGHLRIPVIDSIPASLSSKIMTDLLRRELGFDGLVLTDALNMSALDGLDHVPARCLQAGADILLHPADPDLTVRELLSPVLSKSINEEIMSPAINRILRAKSKLQQVNREVIDYKSNLLLSKQITDMSITIVKQREGIFPIKDMNQVNVVAAGAERLMDDSLWNCYSGNSEAKITLFVIFSETAAWRGSSGIYEEEKNRLIGLIRKAAISVVISFGSPYVLRFFKEADILVAAYEGSVQAQKAVMRCLKGEMEFQGKLPVDLHM